MARGIAGRHGAVGAISIQHVATTRGAAAELPSPIQMRSGFDRQAPCYVVLIQGTFSPPPTPPRVPGQPQLEPRPLSAIVLTVNADTGHIVGSQTIVTGGTPPDLESLGQVILDASDVAPLEDWSWTWSVAELEALQSPTAGAKR